MDLKDLSTCYIPPPLRGSGSLSVRADQSFKSTHTFYLTGNYYMHLLSAIMYKRLVMYSYKHVFFIKGILSILDVNLDHRDFVYIVHMYEINGGFVSVMFDT